jgi:hypothetical protein
VIIYALSVAASPSRRVLMSNTWELYTLWAFVGLDLILSIVLIGICISSFDLLGKANTVSANTSHQPLMHTYITVIMVFEVFSVIVVAYSIYYWYVLYHKVSALHGWIQKVAQNYWVDLISAIAIMAAYALQLVVIGLAFVPFELVQSLQPGSSFTTDNLDMLKTNTTVILSVAIISVVVKAIKAFWSEAWKISAMNVVIESNLVSIPQTRAYPTNGGYPNSSFQSGNYY